MPVRSPGGDTDEDPTTVVPQAAPRRARRRPPSPSRSSSRSPRRPRARSSTSRRSTSARSISTRNNAGRAARQEHADLEDTVDHPAPEVASLSEELEAAAPTPAETTAELETFVRPRRGARPGDPEVPGSTEEPESIEFDQLPGETVEPPRLRTEDDESDDDLLEETPDFLKEAPDGEDLWFEQGKPKDFDFDD